MNRIISLLSILLFSCGMLSHETVSNKEANEFYHIYQVAIDSFVKKKYSQFILIDSTDNRRIQEFNFLGHLNYIRLIQDANLDSSWLIFLKDAEERKTTLPTMKLNSIKTIHTIRLLNKDTLLRIQEKSNNGGRGILGPYGWIDGWMTVSTPIISQAKDKAVVEISYIRDEKDGNGGVLFLEKHRDGKWIVIQHFEMWVS